MNEVLFIHSPAGTLAHLEFLSFWAQFCQHVVLPNNMKFLLPWQSPQTAGPLWFTVAEKLPSRTKATAATEDAQGSECTSIRHSMSGKEDEQDAQASQSLHYFPCCLECLPFSILANTRSMISISSSEKPSWVLHAAHTPTVHSPWSLLFCNSPLADAQLEKFQADGSRDLIQHDLQNSLSF